MRAKSIQGNSIREIAGLLKECKSDGFQPTLAVVFTSLREEWGALQKLLRTEHIDVFGASSNGEFISAEYMTESATMLLLDISREYYRIEIADVEDLNITGVARNMGEVGKRAFSNPGFIISAAHTSLRFEEIIKGLVQTCGDDVQVVGGNSASDSMVGGFIFSNQMRSDKGIMALILDLDRVQLIGEATSGWKPIGTFKTVTDSDGNWVKSLDHQPALDLLLKYMGIDIDFSDEEDLFNKLGNIYPLHIDNADGTSHMLPPLLFNAQERSFMLAGDIANGSRVRFSMPPDFEVVDTVVNSARQKKEHLVDADAMIIFSCVGRLNCLGPMIHDEIGGLMDIWNVPAIGFFTFGEYGRVKNGKPMFHGTTVSWVAIKEK